MFSIEQKTHLILDTAANVHSVKWVVFVTSLVLCYHFLLVIIVRFRYTTTCI